MEEDKINTMEVHRDLSHREQTSTAPRGEQTDNNNQIFLLGDSSMHTLTKGTTGDTLLPHSLHQHLTIQWPVMLLVDQ